MPPANLSDLPEGAKGTGFSAIGPGPFYNVNFGDSPWRKSILYTIIQWWDAVTSHRNMTNKNERVRYTFNPQKALEAILWIAQQRPGKVDLYHTVKAFFFGDLHHLNSYGRPIAGDFYCAMQHGPTPSGTYDLLKGDRLACAGLGEMPFKKDEHDIIIPLREPNLDYLSESDIEALSKGWEVVKDKSFIELKVLADSHPAYKKTWENKETGADVINFSDLIANQDQVAALKEIASFIKI